MSGKIKIKEKLEKAASQLLTLQDAADWIAATRQDWPSLEDETVFPPSANTLKKAALKGRLLTGKLGNQHITTRDAIREYMRNYRPRGEKPSTDSKTPFAAES